MGHACGGLRFFSAKFSPVIHPICVKTKTVYNGSSGGLRGD